MYEKRCGPGRFIREDLEVLRESLRQEGIVPKLRMASVHRLHSPRLDGTLVYQAPEDWKKLQALVCGMQEP